MRNILFRGKRLDNGEWMYGDLIENQGRFFIYHATSETTIECNDDRRIIVAAVEVDPDTVGQYTGLKDRYGDRIWEGDIIHTKQYGKDEYGLNHCGYDIFSVRFINSSFRIESNNRWFYLTDGHHIEVIGNIHDNPDLLK